MPEGDLVRRIGNEYADFIGNTVQVTSPQGRFADEAALLDGEVFREVDTHGKRLFLRIGDRWIHIHLGLYGKVYWYRSPAADPVETVRVRISDAEWTADMRGPMRCELISVEDKVRFHDRMGADPLREGSTIVPYLPWLSRCNWNVRDVLMDQEIFAGVGSIYATELAFLHGMSPWTISSSVAPRTWIAIFDQLKFFMQAGVTRGIVTTDPSHWDSPAKAGSGRTYVYGRTGQPCRVCGSTVEEGFISARRVYWCPRCQP